MKNKNVKDEKKEKKIGLTTKIFIALLLGAVFGIVLCYLIPDSKVKNDIIVEGILYVIGQGFIRLMKMLVAAIEWGEGKYKLSSVMFAVLDKLLHEIHFGAINFYIR